MKARAECARHTQARRHLTQSLGLPRSCQAVVPRLLRLMKWMRRGELIAPRETLALPFLMEAADLLLTCAK